MTEQAHKEVPQTVIYVILTSRLQLTPPPSTTEQRRFLSLNSLIQSLVHGAGGNMAEPRNMNCANYYIREGGVPQVRQNTSNFCSLKNLYLLGSQNNICTSGRDTRGAVVGKTEANGILATHFRNSSPELWTIKK